MPNAVVSARIPPTLKADAEKVFAQLGISPTRAIVLFYELVVRTGRIPDSQTKPDMSGDVRVEVGPWEAPVSPMPSKAAGR